MILQTHVQTQEGKPGNGLVKEEYQAAMKWLFVPLMMKDVEKRARAEDEARDQGKTPAPTFSGKKMWDVIEEWRGQLSSSHKLLKEGKWKSWHLTPIRNAAISAKKTADAAQVTADQAKATMEYWRAEIHRRHGQANALEVFAQAARVAADNDQISTQEQLSNAIQLNGNAHAASWAAMQAIMEWAKAQERFAKAQQEADVAKERHMQRQMTYEEQLQAYVPSKYPFFIMQDNCPSYSMFADKKQKKVLPIVPMLQVWYS